MWDSELVGDGVGDFPANRAYAGFQTQAAYDLLQQRIIAIGHNQASAHLNFAGAIYVFAVESLESHGGVVDGVQKQRADVSLVFSAACHQAGVPGFHLGVLQGLAIYRHRERTEQNVSGDDRERSDACLGQETPSG